MDNQNNLGNKVRPTVDIILPNYNKDNFLDKTLNSIFSQTYKNWKLFIIDDNSFDNSKKIIENYKHQNNKIKVLYLKKNKGVSFCRNLGIRISSSKYISFIDSDDYWTEDKLEKQILFMEKFNYAFTYTNYTPFLVKNGKKIFKKKVIAPDSFNYKQFTNDTSIGMSSAIIERSIIGTIRFKKIKICEDYLFKCEILRKGSLAIKLNQNTMYYQISKNSLQSSKLRNLFWVWHINKKYNYMPFFKNLKSLLFIILSSIKRYGIK